jgi:hypothetical protein
MNVLWRCLVPRVFLRAIGIVVVVKVSYAPASSRPRFVGGKPRGCHRCVAHLSGVKAAPLGEEGSADATADTNTTGINA